MLTALLGITLRLWTACFMLMLMASALAVVLGRRDALYYPLAIAFAVALLVNAWTGGDLGGGCATLCQAVISSTPDGPGRAPLVDGGGVLPPPSTGIVTFIASLLGWPPAEVQALLSTP